MAIHNIMRTIYYYEDLLANDKDVYIGFDLKTKKVFAADSTALFHSPDRIDLISFARCVLLDNKKVTEVNVRRWALEALRHAGLKDEPRLYDMKVTNVERELLKELRGNKRIVMSRVVEFFKELKNFKRPPVMSEAEYRKGLR